MNDEGVMFMKHQKSLSNNVPSRGYYIEEWEPAAAKDG